MLVVVGAALLPTEPFDDFISTGAVKESVLFLALNTYPLCSERERNVVMRVQKLEG